MCPLCCCRCCRMSASPFHILIHRSVSGRDGEKKKAKRGDEEGEGEEVERENVGITFGRRIIFMLCSSFTARHSCTIRIKGGLARNSTKYMALRIPEPHNATEIFQVFSRTFRDNFQAPFIQAAETKKMRFQSFNNIIVKQSY